jgi:hypothetical protein
MAIVWYGKFPRCPTMKAGASGRTQTIRRVSVKLYLFYDEMANVIRTFIKQK